MRPVTAAQSDSSSVEGEHQELGAADAGQHVVLAERHRQGAGHGLQRGVAGLMAQAVVQVLHVADVDEERVDRCALAVGELQQLGPRRHQARAGSGTR